MSLRSGRRIAQDLTPAKKENEEEKIEDKLRDHNKENKDREEKSGIVEKKENEALLAKTNRPKPKEKRIRKQEESDKDSNEEEEKRREKYDEWLKADRIVWPLDKGEPKRKQKKKTKNKEDSEKDEKKDEERQKSKCGLPPLKSTFPSNMSYSVSKSPNIEGKVGALTAQSSFPDISLLANGMEDFATSAKNLMNEEFSPEILEELERSEKFIDDKMEEENPKFPCVLKENDKTQVQSLETLKLEVEESEQIVPNFENKMEQVEEIEKKPKKSPKVKGRKNKAKDLSLKILKISPLRQDEARSHSYIGCLRLEVSLESKDLSSTTKDEKDSCSKEKKLKRKIPAQSSLEKKIRMETEMEMPDLVSEKQISDSIISEKFKELNSEEQPEIEYEEMPSLIAESEQPIQDESAKGFEASTTSSTCSVTVQEREIRDKGQKRKSDGNGGSLAKKQKRSPKRTSAAIKNEKNGARQSNDREDLPVPDSTSKCTPLKPRKLAPSPARMMSLPIKDGDKDRSQDKHQNSSPRIYKWSSQLKELDNMSSAERISFLQETLQEIRKRYMSLKAEVAAIDRRKRLKKKAKLVSNVVA